MSHEVKALRRMHVKSDSQKRCIVHPARRWAKHTLSEAALTKALELDRLRRDLVSEETEARLLSAGCKGMQRMSAGHCHESQPIG